ncbi:outer membrane beta-barrel protein [Pricia sp. S334]|uniref:Outer membrane beta-barrel protein n=1 Tax=Pricia mediterranea TaxID=3076079 RepID=A0ABU3L7K0_9FLAO|nr:outer membrane beta-barrel protein [Pricia sp. S334]MDT7829720.1 outer membrane beta-barrel protein [Pricia sp. S334]
MKVITRTNYVKNLFLLGLILFSTAPLFAQSTEDNETKPKFSFSGSVDAYYRTNLSTTDRSETDVEGNVVSPVPAPATSFADQTGFALGMANLLFTYENQRVGAVADVVFGPRGDDAVAGNNLNQLYVFVNVSENTRLTLGRFNTYLGYEVIAPEGNFNYSTSYLFSNGPFSHVGLKADFAFSSDLSLMIAIMNVTDTDTNLGGAYSVGAQVGYSDQFLNFYYDGGEGLGFELDYTGGFDLSDRLYLGLNAAYENNDGDSFTGAALYPQFTASEHFAIGLRGEYFSTHVNGDSDDPSVFAATLTGSYTIDNFIVKPEIRLDSWHNDTPFLDHGADPSKSLSSILLAAIYSF